MRAKINLFDKDPFSSCEDEHPNIGMLHLRRSIIIQNLMVSRWLVQILHSLQKFECLPFWNFLSYGIKIYGVEVIFNGMTSLQNFIKITSFVYNLLWGGAHIQTDRRT
jgi:hypothetical protein